MKHGVLGTGMVGQAIATKLAGLGHEVKMGSRTAAGGKAAAWAKAAGAKASSGTFAEAAAFGEVLWNCTKGEASLAALEQAGSRNLDGKILVDVANPLDFSKGMPPSLFVCNTDSLGEQIQRANPGAKVVKALNTINADVMVEPGKLPGEHAVFVCGNDPGAKGRVVEILSGELGWRRVVDLGDITAARGTEAYLLLWIRLMGALGTARFNVGIVK
ncbi:MAG: NAD(P)-binding domain-containing protein [Deltaproteobacteria bacterium]|nr:NAD(P)-binding domain-containing protein [Deltaproteobacteria bacterium]